jgi:hypothetical protein
MNAIKLVARTSGKQKKKTVYTTCSDFEKYGRETLIRWLECGMYDQVEKYVMTDEKWKKLYVYVTTFDWRKQ